MTRSIFIDIQIMDTLKRVDPDLGILEVCHELGSGTATFYRCHAEYCGMSASMTARIKDLKTENTRLKKMYIKEKLKAEIMTKALTKVVRPSHRHKKAGR